MIEIAERSRPARLGVDDPKEQPTEQAGTSLVRRYAVDLRAGFLHSLSTTSTTSGITSRILIASSWISPLWPRRAAGYSSSCPKGQVRTAGTEPWSDPRIGQGVGPRWPQGRNRQHPATSRDCEQSQPLSVDPEGSPPVPSGAFVCPANRDSGRAPRPCAARHIPLRSQPGWAGDGHLSAQVVKVRGSGREGPI
jgi:hypothetical protein